MSNLTPQPSMLNQSEKIDLIKSHLEFIVSTGSHFDFILDLLLEVRELHQAVCTVFDASEVLNVIRNINISLFDIADMSIGEFEPFAEFGYRPDKPYSISPNSFLAEQAKAKKS